MGPRNCVLHGVQIPPREGHFWGETTSEFFQTPQHHSLWLWCRDFPASHQNSLDTCLFMNYWFHRHICEKMFPLQLIGDNFLIWWGKANTLCVCKMSEDMHCINLEDFIRLVHGMCSHGEMLFQNLIIFKADGAVNWHAWTSSAVLGESWESNVWVDEIQYTALPVRPCWRLVDVAKKLIWPHTDLCYVFCLSRTRVVILIKMNWGNFSAIFFQTFTGNDLHNGNFWYV